MPAPWQTWKKTLSCKADLDQVHEPKPVPSKTSSKKSSRRSSKHRGEGGSTTRASSGGGHEKRERGSHQSQGGVAVSTCSRSLKDVIHGNTRVMHKQSSSCSPVSQESGGSSSEYLNIVADDVIVGERGLLGTTGISYYCGTPLSSSYVYSGYHHRGSITGTPLRRFSGCYDCTNLVPVGNSGYDSLDHGARDSPLNNSHDSPKPGCHKCGRLFNKLETLEQHLITQHAVTELNPGDSSRNVVEIIFRTSWLKKELPCGRIERILKVHNTQRTINKFEEYRDAVKARASKLPKKHPRCLADGNELLRFYGTTLACPLGFNGSSSLCSQLGCTACRIIRSGFSGVNKGTEGGIHTTSTSGKAHDCIPWPYDDDDDLCKAKRAMLVCRVIAGRVHMDENQGLLLDSSATPSAPPPGFDSVSADAGPYSNMGDLLVFNTRALLPCFVVIYTV